MGVLGPMITPGSIEVLALDTFRPAHISPKQPDVGDYFVASMSTYTVTDPEGFEEFLKTIDLSALLSDDVYVMGVATSSTDPSMYCSMSSWASKEAQQAAAESPAYAEIMGQAATYIDMDSLKREVHSVHMFQKSI